MTVPADERAAIAVLREASPAEAAPVALEAYRVPPGARLRDALLAIDRSGGEIALVVDAAGRLIGTLTDGDIRRALLKGASLDAPLAHFLHRDFSTAPVGASRAEILDLMQARQIRQVPVVDSSGRLVGLHLLDAILGTLERPNWAVVMAGGKGSRLRPITEHVPKPMIRVAGRPILERLLLHLVGYGFRRVFLSINYLGHMVEEYFGDGSRFGCHIEYLREEAPLGTGGALSLLPERPRDPFLVMNGDLVTQVNLHEMLAFHAGGPQVATLGVRKYFHTVPFGCVELDGDRILGMIEKPCLVRCVNAGVYVLNPELAAAVPAGEAFGLPTLLEHCLVRSQTVCAYEIEDDWIDVGQREQLREAQGLAA